MNAPRRANDRNAIRRVVLPSAVLLVALGAGGRASASGAVDWHRLFDESHPEACGCGMACRPSSCCCGPRASKSRPMTPPVASAPRATPASAPTPGHVHEHAPDARPEPGPCLGALPCGEDGLPTATAAPMARMAAVLPRGLRPDPAPSSLLPEPPACRLPARLGTPPDEPPERAD